VCNISHGVVIFLLFTGTLLSLIVFFTIAEVNFNGILHTGKYGSGVQRFWSKVHSNHILAFYPISKESWLKGFDT